MIDNCVQNAIAQEGGIPIKYIKRGFGDPAGWFLNLQHQIPWERRSDAPRSECYFNDNLIPYTYGVGRGVRTYEAHPFTMDLTFMRMNVEAAAYELYGKQYNFGALFLNRYHDQSDHLGWHADDSPEMDDETPIAIVTFGAERDIMFRKNGSGPEDVIRIKLESGSICFMDPGMQDTHQHRIPKAGFQCGERISLTFRGFVEVANEN